MPKTTNRSTRVLTILSRVFIPIGIVFLLSAVLLLSFGIPSLVRVIPELRASGECVETSSGVRCSGPVTTTFVGALFMVIFGGNSLFVGLPFAIVGFVFLHVVSSRKKEPARPIDSFIEGDDKIS